MGIEALRFLVGQWRGDGTVRGERVDADIAGTFRREDGAIVLVHVTRAPGKPQHRERIELRERRNRLTAHIQADGMAKQEFRSVPADRGWRFEYRHPKTGLVAWEIQTVPDEDSFSERFIVGESASAETVVVLHHVRVQT